MNKYILSTNDCWKISHFENHYNDFIGNKKNLFVGFSNISPNFCPSPNFPLIKVDIKENNKAKNFRWIQIVKVNVNPTKIGEYKALTLKSEAKEWLFVDTSYNNIRKGLPFYYDYNGYQPFWDNPSWGCPPLHKGPAQPNDGNILKWSAFTFLVQVEKKQNYSDKKD